MDKKPLISVIVPVYKVEPYLEKCVRSLTAQTLSDIEIILVDDGSPDRSGEMCEQFAREDSRITVYHKQNGGLSDARNYGIERAKADLLGFVDSDDFVDPDMYEVLYNNMMREGADISMCGTLSEYAHKSLPAYKGNEYFTLDRETAAKMVLEGRKIQVSAWNKLYKKSLFENVRYPVGMIYEDANVILEIILGIEKAVVDTTPRYHYVHREGSITTSVYRQKDKDIVAAFEKNLKIAREHFPDAVEAAEFRLYWARFCLLDRMTMSREFAFKDDYAEQKAAVLKAFLPL